MAGLSATTAPLITPDQSYPADIGLAAQQVRNWPFQGSQDLATALENLQDNANQLQNAARQPSDVQQIIVRDTSGRVIAALGSFETNGVQTSGGMFAELYAGFPFGISDPSQAIFRVTPDGEVSIGQNGWVDVLDPFGGDAAWIGTQYDTLPVTGAINNGSGLIRLTVTAHTLLTGDSVQVRDVGGLLDGFGANVAQGVFTVTYVDANHIDLQNSLFEGTYTSGGTVTRLLHIAAISNHSGKIQIQTTFAHGYITGDQVSISGVTGGSVNGQWVITVIDSTHFDLNGSTFSGGSGGIVVRYFAGGLFETIAVAGTSFQNAKLRALANGELLITDAFIQLVGSGATITLDPTVGQITIQAASPGASETTINANGILIQSNVASESTITLDATDGSVTVAANSPAVMETRIDVGGVTVFSQAGSSPGLFLQNSSIILNSDVTYSGGIFSSGPGPQVTVLDSEIDIQDNLGSINIQIKSDGSITAAGTINGHQLATAGVIVIDNLQNAKNLASVDSVLYKVGGTTGLGVVQTVVESITLNTGTFVTNITSGGVSFSTGSAVTGATIVTKTLTFDSGILITDT